MSLSVYEYDISAFDEGLFHGQFGEEVIADSDIGSLYSYIKQKGDKVFIFMTADLTPFQESLLDEYVDLHVPFMPEEDFIENVGVGAAVFKGIDGLATQFKTINPLSNRVKITANVDTVDVDVDRDATLGCTTKGEVLIYDGSTHQCVAPGSNNEVLMSDNTDPNGVAWKKPSIKLNKGGAAVANTPHNGINFTGGVSITDLGNGQAEINIEGEALPCTAKGDIIVFDGSSHVCLPVGADGQILKADSSTATGVDWDDAEEEDDCLNIYCVTDNTKQSTTANTYQQALRLNFTAESNQSWVFHWYVEVMTTYSKAHVQTKIQLDDTICLGQTRTLTVVGPENTSSDSGTNGGNSSSSSSHDASGSKSEDDGMDPYVSVSGWDVRSNFTAGPHYVDLDYKSSKSGKKVKIRRIRLYAFCVNEQ